MVKTNEPTFVPEMNRKSWLREGSKKAIFFATVS